MVQVALSDLQTYINAGVATELVNDTTPQLGGNLDINSKFITGNLLPSIDDSYQILKYPVTNIQYVKYLRDYSDELIGARFVIDNPNATSSCGCGTSFAI